MTATPPPDHDPDRILALLDRLAGIIAAPGWSWARTLQLILLIGAAASAVVLIAVYAPAILGYAGASVGGYAAGRKHRDRLIVNKIDRPPQPPMDSCAVSGNFRQDGRDSDAGTGSSDIRQPRKQSHKRVAGPSAR
jgi:hypothetical protein